MGDTPVGSQPVGDYSNASQTARANVSQLSSPGLYDETEARRAQHGAFQSTSSQSGHSPNQPYPPQQHTSQSRQEPFGMASLSSALPDVSYQSYNQLAPQRFPPSPSSSALAFQMQNIPQFGNPSAMGQPAGNAPYNIPYQAQYQGMYAQGHAPSPQHLQSTAPSGTQFYHGQGFIGQPQQPGSPFFIQPSQYGPQGHMYATSPSVAQYGVRGSFPNESRVLPQQRSNEYLGGGPSAPGRSSSIASSPGQSSVVRGPPRKPRQSGHAIWIGNLPPQTDLMSLVLHVCKETSGLESLFLISKSNCAFANFKDEAACAAAQLKIHDSRFQTVRLVSRLRRSSVGTTAGVAVPTGPAALTPPSAPTVARSPSPGNDTKSKEAEVETDETKENEDVPLPKDKFFVVKSLTVEDLELSVRNGIWATQSHNEEALNKAYETADNVYLIFSANKSGEYFGYARMISPINDDPAAAIEFAPKAQAVEDPELPKAIPTPATEFAPKGRIIDDSARGTIFWEAERDEGEGEEEEETRSNRSDHDESPPPSKAWGKPFKIEWISTTRLPFYRTRGLRNPWNSNREVKIARDGTELETTIGRRLLGLFHRLPSPSAQPLPHMQNMPIQFTGGYPQMRPPFS